MKKYIFVFILLFNGLLFAQNYDTLNKDYKLIKLMFEKPNGYNIYNLIVNPFDRIYGIDFILPDTSLVIICIKKHDTDSIINILFNDILSDGKYRFEWNGKDKFGNIVETGYYDIEFKAIIENRKAILRKEFYGKIKLVVL